MLSSDLPAVLIVLAIMLLVAFPVHEFSHALVAYRLGDATAKLRGRLTLSPAAHFDPLGGTLLALTMLTSGFGFGWAKPTPMSPQMLRGGRQGEAMVALAGPLSNFVMACVGAVIYRILDLAAPSLAFALPGQVLFFFVLINLGLMIFNLVPIPPLDGSKVLFGVLPPRVSWQWRPVLEQYGGIILLVAVFVPIFPGNQTLFGFVFRILLDPLLSLLLGL